MHHDLFNIKGKLAPIYRDIFNWNKKDLYLVNILYNIYESIWYYVDMVTKTYQPSYDNITNTIKLSKIN